MLQKILFFLAGLFQRPNEKAAAKNYVPTGDYSLKALLFSQLMVYARQTDPSGEARQHYVINRALQIWIVALISSVAFGLAGLLVWHGFLLASVVCAGVLFFSSMNLSRLSIFLSYGNRLFRPTLTGLIAYFYANYTAYMYYIIAVKTTEEAALLHGAFPIPSGTILPAVILVLGIGALVWALLTGKRQPSSVHSKM